MNPTVVITATHRALQQRNAERGRTGFNLATQNNRPNPVSGSVGAMTIAQILANGIPRIIGRNTPNDIRVEDITEEAVRNVLNNTPADITTTDLLNNTLQLLDGQCACPADSCVCPKRQLKLAENPDKVVEDVRVDIALAVPQNAGRSADNPSPQEEARRCNGSAIACIICCVICVVVGVSFATGVFAQLDFITRKPGEERKESDREPPGDKDIVDMWNMAAAEQGIDVSKPFTKDELKDMLKEAVEWYHMTEKEFWKKIKIRGVKDEERMSVDKLCYQLLYLDAFSDVAFIMIAHKPAFSWIFPKDGAVLSTVLASIYKEKGVAAMYDCMAEYKYYNKTLPRAVAIDCVIAALTLVMPKKTE